MKRARPTAGRVLRALAAAAATAGLLVAQRAWWLAPVVAAVAASPLFEWQRVPPRLVRALRVALRLTLLLTLVAVWFTSPVPVLARSAGWLPTAFGTILALLVAVFALAPRAFPAGRTLAPALVGLMVVAGADPTPRGFSASAVVAFQAAGHNAFAELYLGLAVVVVAALWAAELTADGPSWRGRAALLLASVAGLTIALALAGVIGLPTAQPRVESAVAEAFQQPTTGLSGESTLGEFSGLAVSRRRVLDLRASEAAGSHWLLRSEVLTQFDGRRWTGGSGGPAQTLVPGAPPAVPAPLLAGLGPWFPLPGGTRPGPAQLRVTQHLLDTWPLLLPGPLAAVTADADYLELDAARLVRRVPGATVAMYGAVLATSPPPATPLGEAEVARDLAVPQALDPRVRALADELFQGAAGDAGRVERTLRHLRTRYRYTLQPGGFRPGGDPVAEFLFEKKQGYCEYFATAAVLLLRAQRIPARFVKGLSVGPQDDYGGGLYVVREADAHAWAEAYLEGRGWVEIDPTPPDAFAAAHPAPATLDRLLERFRAALAEAWARLTGPGLVSFLRWLADGLASLGRAAVGHPLLLAGLALAVASPRLARFVLARYRQRWRRRAVRAASGVPRELQQAIDELERRWRQLGRPRPPSRGLREHALAQQLPAAEWPAPAAEAGRNLIELYYRARFGGQPPALEEVGRLRAALQAGTNSRTGARSEA